MTFMIKSSALRGFLCLFCILLSYVKATSQSGCPAPFQVLKQKKVANINIPGNSIIHGYLEHLPDDYNSTTKKYPLLVYIHGVNETGNGTVTELCDLMFEWNWEPPTQVELGKFPYSVTDQNGTVHKFILISPQLQYFADPSITINTLLDYLQNRYRIDAGRIYLTGISAGADYINSYAGSSLANARRVAAITPVALCGGINSTQAANMANAQTHVWTFKCGADNTCGSSSVGDNEMNLINSYAPAANLAWSSTFPVNGTPCNNPVHNIWGNAYDTLYKENVYGRTVNQYEWMVQFSRTVANAPLPVALEDFSVRLSGGKVYLSWTTSGEANSSYFSIERSGSGQQYAELTTLPAAGNNAGSKTYAWTDDKPLTSLNYYRLSQTDLDGQKQYFPIKKILNRQQWGRPVIVSPNPFTTDISVFINVDKSQKVTFILTDMSGRILKTVYGAYSEGTAEVMLPAAELPRGLYFLKVEGENFSEVQKLVKE